MDVFHSLPQAGDTDTTDPEILYAALTLGGSIRVGLEDNFYLPDGEMARSNGELIAKARQMTEDAGRRPATVQEARRLLGIAQPEAVPASP